MDIEQRLRKSVAAKDPGLAFTAGVMARVKGQSQKRSRFILIGTVVVVAAAAAMVGLQLTSIAPQPAVAAALAPTSAAISDTVEPVEPVLDLTVVANADAARPAAIAIPAKRQQSFTVSVLPLTQLSDAPDSRLALDSFYGSLLDELRKVPNLVMVDSSQSADYRITVNGIVPGVGVSTPKIYGREAAFVNILVPTTDAGSPNATPDARRWNAKVVVNIVGQSLAAGMSYATTTTGGLVETATIASGDAGSIFTSLVSGLMEGECPKFIGPQQSAHKICDIPKAAAISFVNNLRKYVFPPDPSLQRQLVARLQDSGLDKGLRMQTTKELEDLLRRASGSWEESTLRAISDLIATTADADERLQMLSMLRDVRDPALLQPLLNSMRSDADIRVRLGAMWFLQNDYAADQAVRAAFEAVATDDRQELVRQAALRVLGNEAGWRDYVGANLRNVTLTDDARLEPLGYIAQSRELISELPTILSDATMKSLAEMLPRMWRNPEQVDTAAKVMGLLGQVDRPDVVDLMTSALRNGPESLSRAMAFRLMSGTHGNESGVRQALEEASARDPQLRKLLEGTPPSLQILSQPPAPPR